jgi:hypothetical protein
MTAHDAVRQLLDPTGTHIPDLGVVVSATAR